MTRRELNDEYFNWMFNLISIPNRRGYYASHRFLLRYLHEVDFVYTMPMDANRADDGISLRYRFGSEKGYSQALIASDLDVMPCSMLEMMVALASRCEEHIMDDPDVGNRTWLWFWEMIDSLGLDGMNNANFDFRYVDDILNRFVDREYDSSGKGGLFHVNDPSKDMRTLDIWYQMCAYINVIL